jgi:hypothetical protein
LKIIEIKNSQMQTVSIPKLIYSRATIWAAKPLEKGSVDASTQLML